jgi:hypothetical protein
VASRERFDGGDTCFGGLGIGLVALEADIAAAETLCDSTGRAGAVEQVDHQIASFDDDSNTRARRPSGFWVG